MFSQMASYKIITIIFIINNVAVLPSLGDLKGLKGLVAPAFTPINDQGELSVEVIPQYAQYLAANHVKGVLMGSALGEGPTLTVSDMKTLISCWMDAAKPLNLKVIVQVGGRPLPDTKELARYSEEKGVDAILSVPEVFYKPNTIERLVYNMKHIAEAAPETPLLYYDIPEITKVKANMIEFTRQALKEIPTFMGYKASLETALLVQPLLKKKGQTILVADSLYLAPAVFMGFNTFSMTEINLFPRLFSNIIKSGISCNLNETLWQYRYLLDTSNTINYLRTVVNFPPAFKEAMLLVTGIDVGPPTPPLMPLSEQEKMEMKEKLVKKGVKIVDRRTG